MPPLSSSYTERSRRQYASAVRPAGMIATLFAACAGFDCANSTHRTPDTAIPRLVVSGAELWHEVEIRGLGREELLVGVLSFTSSASFRLEAQTPFGVTVFEVGFDGHRFAHELAPFLEGRIPGEFLARDIYRIYFGGCPSQSAPSRQCLLPDGSSLREHLSGDPPHLTMRIYDDAGGRRTTIHYREWTRFGSFTHPRRIDLLSEGFSVAVALSELRLDPPQTVPADSAAARTVSSMRR